MCKQGKTYRISICYLRKPSCMMDTWESSPAQMWICSLPYRLQTLALILPVEQQVERTYRIWSWQVWDFSDFEESISQDPIAYSQLNKTTYASEWGGLPPRHVVCSLTSVSDVGGPVEVYVGVSEGSQKSGNLCLSDSACSRSICLSAASSASCARVSAVVDEKENLRFVPRAKCCHCWDFRDRYSWSKTYAH